jgi:hypothetical protein
MNSHVKLSEKNALPVNWAYLPDFFAAARQGFVVTAPPLA